MTDKSEMVRVRCTCGASLLAPISAAGRSSNCPKCGEMVSVPMATEADFGVEPGQLNLAMGKGITYCIIAGLVAAGVWAGICALVEGQIGLLMCAIGAACGLGMMMGTQRRSAETGLIAGGISIACVMAGKCLLAAILASGSAGHATPEEQNEARLQRDGVAGAMMIDELLEKDPELSAEQAEETVEAKLASMTETQKQQYLDQKVSQASARAQAMRGKAGGAGGLGMRETVGFVALLLAFGMWDIISMLFGAALAYGIATFNDVT